MLVHTLISVPPRPKRRRESAENFAFLSAAFGDLIMQWLSIKIFVKYAVQYHNNATMRKWKF